MKPVLLTGLASQMVGPLPPELLSLIQFWWGLRVFRVCCYPQSYPQFAFHPYLHCLTDKPFSCMLGFGLGHVRGVTE